MGQPEAVPAAMNRLTEASDRADALRWATMLRTVPNGWTEELRTAYWRWLESTNDSAGGFSLRGFIDQVKTRFACFGNELFHLVDERSCRRLFEA